MTNISCYDDDADVIEEICEEKDITEAELIAGLLEAVAEGEINVDDWV